jgi:hypothetical protein
MWLGPLLSRAGLAAMAAGIGLAAAALGGTSAYADTLTNGPTIPPGRLFHPGHRPRLPERRRRSADLSRQPGKSGHHRHDRVLNRWHRQHLRGQHPWRLERLGHASGDQRVLLRQCQVWYFQKVGYLGVNSEFSREYSTSSGPVELAVPVYRILN